MHENLHELSYLTDVEWKTIFLFFIGLFIRIDGLAKVGMIC